MLAILRSNPAFVRLWSAQVISQAGDWLNRIAVLTLIGALGGPTQAVGLGSLYGLELCLRVLPSGLLGPIAGPIADRLPRRAVLVAADLVRAVVVASLWFVREPDDLPWLYALVALQMATAIFFDAARSAAIPDTVRPQDLATAHAISAATWSVMLSAGALAGGALVSWLGVHPVFLVDAASYVGSALCLRGLQLPPTPAQPRPLRWRDVIALRELRRGYEHARSVGVGPVLWAKTCWGGAGGFLVLLSLAGQERAGTGERASAGAAAVATSILYAARGLGTGVGPFLAQRGFGTTDRGLRLQIAWSFAIAAVGYAAFGAAASLGAEAAWVAVAHVGGATIWVGSTVLWQRHVASEFRGRVYAFETLWMDLGFAAGALTAGAIHDATRSLQTATWTMSAVVLAAGAGWAWLARGTGGGAKGLASGPGSG